MKNQREVKIKAKAAAYAPLEDFVWFQGELKILTDERYEQLKALILELGFSEAPAVWIDGDKLNLLNGHQRILTLQRMKKEGFRIPHVPYQVVEAENEEEAKRKVLSLTSQFGEITEGGLAKFIHGTTITRDELKADFALPGVNIDDLPEVKVEIVSQHDRLIVDEEKEKNEDTIPVVKDPICKPGQLWILGEHRLLCGDSTNEKEVERLMGDQKAQMLFTDPPYGVDYDGGTKVREKLAGDDKPDLYVRVAPVIQRFVDGPCYTWFADKFAKDVLDGILGIGEVHAMVIWQKQQPSFSMNAHYKYKHEPCFYWKPKGCTLRWNGPTNETTVWEERRESQNKMHPTQKPVALAERAIKNHTALTVLDLFGGSGSTLIAAEKTGRKAFIMEISPAYCDVIVARWEQHTGQKAKLSKV